MALLDAVIISVLVLAPPAAPEVSPRMRREIVGRLEGLEKQWFQVYETHDLSALERLIAEDFVATLADGAMRGKREHIAAYPADFEALASVTNSELRVRVFAPDVAVATGLYTATLRGKAGPEAVTRFRYTDTWLLRRGSWQCVATHENRVDAEETKRAPCCFVNPRYSGVCQIEPSDDETCTSILAYLNNPTSSGKSYCSNTDIRQGWTRAKCK